MVVDVVLDQSPEMSFVEHDEMVEDFAEAASYSALGNAILPGRLNTRPLRVQTCGHQDGDHIAIKLRVVVQEGIAVRTSLWKCFPRLVAPTRSAVG